MEQQRILAVFAHPDDETIVGGTLIQHIKQGAHVTYVCMTLGEMGRNMGVPPFASRVTLPLIRQRELAEACRTLGIQDVRHLGLHDKMVEFEDLDLWAQKMSQIIEELRPDIIYTFYPGLSVHPDHDACGEIVIRGVKSMPAASRPEVRCVAMTSNCKDVLGPPHFVNDVSEWVDQKVQAIKAHKSQFQLMLGDYGPEKKERYKRERMWRYQF
ncbi:bacillithiol biosynthesis deacetylase BshB2 [Paenibacillus marinisediminis]